MVRPDATAHHGGQRVLMAERRSRRQAGALIAIHGRDAGGPRTSSHLPRRSRRPTSRSCSASREYLVPLPLSRTNGTERTGSLPRCESWRT